MDPTSPATTKFKPTKKVFDIVRPGKPMASPSSRPLIITNKPQVVDKQVTPASFGGAGSSAVAVASGPEPVTPAPPRIRSAVKPPTAPRLQGSHATQRPLMRHPAVVQPMSNNPETTLSVAQAPEATDLPTAPTLPKKSSAKIAVGKPHEVKITQKDDKKGEGKVAVTVTPDDADDDQPFAIKTASVKATAKSKPTPIVPASTSPLMPVPQSASASPSPSIPTAPALSPLSFAKKADADAKAEVNADAETSPADSLLEPLTDDEMEAIKLLSDSEQKTAPILAPRPHFVEEPEAPEPEDEPTPEEPSKAAEQGSPLPVAPTEERPEPQQPREEPEPAKRETIGVPTKDPDLKHEDIMAGAGMSMPRHDAPLPVRAVTVHHRHKIAWWQWLLIVLLTILIGLVAFNFLIDAELLKVNVDIPTTNLL